ncbi:FtsX-like permease family protein [Streptomyces sp. I05A-00742]|uniref:FtsX-like permease family protein n=1 Tax=Streptomyces sp. I05A-00742 TaxID=2732853 RepID=UPI001488E9D8|nr:FtsX-like permease family protein [Streptomyces sp. I05A-00742]
MGELVFRTLRYRRTSFVATFLAMFLGAAIVMGCGGLLETGIRMAAPPQRLAAAPVVVTGPQDDGSAALSERSRLDAALVGKIQSVPGVRQAVADVSFPATVLAGGKPVAGASGSAGHPWESARLTPYALRHGQAPARDGDIVLDAGLAARSGASVGSGVELAAHGTARRYTVTGIAAQQGGHDAPPAVFFTGTEARRLAAADGRIDSIGVLPAPGTRVADLAAAVEKAVGDRATVLTGDRRGLAELPGTMTARKTVVILASIFGSWAVLVVMFGVASALGLSLQQRRREMALLRAIGATSRQVRRMILAETAVLAVVATALAAIPGRYLGELLFGQLTGHGVVPDAIAFHESWIPVVTGAAVAVVAALGATLLAGRRAARTKPLAALADSTDRTRWFTGPRLLLALLFLTGGLSLSVATATVMDDGPSLASTAGPASVLFAIGCALLAPGITKGFAVLLRGPVRLLTGLPGELAAHNTAVRNVRTAGVVAPVVLLVGIATGTLYMQATEDHVSARSYSRNVLADYVVTSSAGGFAPDAVDAFRRVPGVAGASELVTSTGRVEARGGGTDVDLRGVSAAGADRTLAVHPVTGSLDGLRGDTVALSDRQAETFGVRVGDTLPLRLGDGTRTTPKVVALYADDPKQRYLLLPSRVLAAHTTGGLPTRILVRAAPDAGHGLRERLDRVAAARPGAEVADRSALTASNGQIQQILVSANYTIVAMIVGYAAITVVNALVAVARDRRREFGLQRLTGATRAQVIGMLGVEGGLVTVVGTVLGTVAAATTVVPYALVKNDSPLPAGSVGLYLAIVGGALALVLGATLVPAWRGMRTPPVETVTRPA